MSETGTRQGRKRDAQRSREAILEAAEAVFAQFGFDGARVDAIAKASGYNISLIFQYFGDKPGLYAEVLRKAYRETNELRARVFTPLVEQGSSGSDTAQFRSFIETAVGGLFDYLADHPKLVHILLWEMADGWQTYSAISRELAVETEKLERFEIIFQQARQAGLLRSDLPAAVQLMQVLQVCLSYLSSLSLYQGFLPDEDIYAEESRARNRAYIVAFAVGGMMVNASESNG